MAKNNKKNNKVLDKDVELTRMLTSATIQSGTVKYTNSKVGGLKKKLVDSIMRMIGSSISPDNKTILNELGVDASIKQRIDTGMNVTELYLRDKNVKSSKKVKVRTRYDLVDDIHGVSKHEKIHFAKQHDVVKGISDYCESMMGKWSDVRGSADKICKEDADKELKELKKISKKKNKTMDEMFRLARLTPGEHYIVVTEWLYPTESGRDVITDKFATKDEALSRCFELCNDELELDRCFLNLGMDDIPREQICSKEFVDKDGNVGATISYPNCEKNKWFFRAKVVGVKII